ncbi:MAG: TIGR02266 family protein [Myxococcota bacterium]
MKMSVQKPGSSPTGDASAPSGEERRRWDRAELVVRVDYKTVDELFSEFARNINEGGLFVETDTPPPPGSVVALQFQIPGSHEPIQVLGRVVRITDGDAHEGPGMGIEFEDLDEQSRDLINDLVRNLRVGPAE